MTIRTITRLALAGILGGALLTACASGPALVPAGKLTVASPYSVTLDRNWSDVSSLFYVKALKVKILSIDGINLNRLYVSDGLSAADPLMINPMKPDNANSPAPRGKADMSLSEQMEFVAASVTALDYQKVTTLNPKPVTIGDSKGVRFEFTARTTDGLNMHGLAQAVSKGGLSYYIVYIAPEEHYYQASLANATAVMDSAKLP